MKDWNRQALPLDPGHGWKARPGCQVFVADRGALRIDVPEGWVASPGEGSIRFQDAAPPADECCLEVSYFKLPPVKLKGLPLHKMLSNALSPETGFHGPIQDASRPGIEIVWSLTTFSDQGRQARTRTALARGSRIQALLTLVSWADDEALVAKAWNDVLSSLALGQWVSDPKKGPGPD